MNRTTVSLFEAEYGRYKRLGDGAFDQLEQGEFIQRPEGGNSIATIVWHIAGNLESRFTDFLTADGEKPWREREAEFEPRPASPAQIVDKWEKGWSVLLGALGELGDEDLARTVSIRGVEFRVDEALLRSLAHTSYHVGQIIYAGKRLRGVGWRHLSIPPGGTAEYNANPTLEKGGRAPA